MSAAVELPSGELGEAVRFEGEVLHVVLPRAFAPGAPLALRVVLEDAGVDLQGKTVGSKRREDGRYDVRARLVSLRRADRERLAVLKG